MYLFGSYAKGTWIRTSDIDLIIVSQDFDGMKHLDRLDLIYRSEWMLKTRPFIEVIPLTPEELRERLRTSTVIRDAQKYWTGIA